MSGKAPAQRKTGSGVGVWSLFDARASMKRRTASWRSGPKVRADLALHARPVCSHN